MIRKDLVSRASSILSKKRVRKLVPAIKSKLFIRDEEGNESQFVVKHEQRGYLLNEADVDAVLDALLEAVIEFMKEGEELKLYGIGTLAPQYWKPRQIRFVDGSGLNTLDGHYIPKFTPGRYLKEAVNSYASTLGGKEAEAVDDEVNEDGD